MAKTSKDELSGMTVNERLFSLGLLDEWDEAIQERDRSKMINVLRQCEVSWQQCEQTTDAVLANPKRYGF